MIDWVHSVWPFVVTISLLVFVHEWGHYIVARAFGVHVDVFSVGFGKALWSRRDRHGTLWCVSLIPLGGYVQFRGDADATSMRTRHAKVDRTYFYGQPPLPRLAILSAGPLANMLAAVGILALALSLYGRPYVDAVIDAVIPESAAQEQGLQAGDRILAINDQAVQEFADIAKHVNQGQSLRLTILRDHAQRDVHITPRRMAVDGGAERWMLGIQGATQHTEALWPWQALGAAVVMTYESAGRILTSVGRLVMQEDSLGRLGGPVEIARMSAQSWDQGLQALLYWVAFISVNLAILNMLPIPPLDGGQMVLTGVEWARRGAITDRLRMAVQGAGFVFLVLFFIVVTWNDVVRWLGS